MIIQEDYISQEYKDYEIELERKKQEQIEIAKKNEERKKNLKVVKSAFKSINRSWKFWLFMLLVVPGGIAGGYYQWGFGSMEPFKPEASRLFSFMCFCGLVVLGFLFSRFKNSLSLKNHLPVDCKKCVKNMPDSPNDFVRDLYCSLHCKRCFYFWTSWCMAALGIIVLTYLGMYSWCFHGTSGLKSRFEQWSNPEQWGILKKISLGAAGLIFVSIVGYFPWNRRVKKAISCLENVYGKERLVSESDLANKFHSTNKICKSTVFFITGVLGFFVYIFFKRLILSLFNKSFSI